MNFFFFSLSDISRKVSVNVNCETFKSWLQAIFSFGILVYKLSGREHYPSLSESHIRLHIYFTTKQKKIHAADYLPMWERERELKIISDFSHSNPKSQRLSPERKVFNNNTHNGHAILITRMFMKKKVWKLFLAR